MSMDKSHKLTKEVNNAIKIIGDDHVLCIIGSLQNGGMRFNELQRAIEVNPVTLTDRLTKLEQEQIIIRKEETLDKVSVVYELTKKGMDTLPIITEIAKFAKKHL